MPAASAPPPTATAVATPPPTSSATAARPSRDRAVSRRRLRPTTSATTQSAATPNPIIVKTAPSARRGDRGRVGRRTRGLDAAVAHADDAIGRGGDLFVVR